jgi:ribose-phosphate pyrophosphokinase
MNGDIKLFAGTANLPLATQIAAKLNRRLEPVTVKKFSDGETFVELEQNVRGCKAFIIQPTCAPTNETLMELMLIADALRRSSAQEIYAVIPYFGYARQDRRPGYSRVPISARVVATMLEGVGVDHIVTIDLHATQIQGFFHIPVDNISASNLFVNDIYHRWMGENPIIVSPDVGGVARARAVAKSLKDMDLAIVDKRRPKANVSEVMNIIGDVTDRTCIMIDDMVDTAGTLAKAANALIEVGGARRVVAYASHGVLSGNALSNLLDSKLEQLVVTDTIPIGPLFALKVRTISTAHILADTIARVSSGGSVRELLD